MNISGVDVRLYAGIGEPDPNLAGWYIFCNDRLMVAKDRTSLTGWEGGKKYYDDGGVQKFHNKVAMFRGLVFFFSKDPNKLPMTTTKWGIDVNSVIYKSVRSRMVEVMKLILAELNKINSSSERQKIVNNSSPIELISYQNDHKLKSEFKFPKILDTSVDSKKTLVCYKVDRELMNSVKKEMNVKTNTEVGENTFQYYVEMKEINE